MALNRKQAVDVMQLYLDEFKRMNSEGPEEIGYRNIAVVQEFLDYVKIHGAEMERKFNAKN